MTFLCYNCLHFLINFVKNRLILAKLFWSDFNILIYFLNTRPFIFIRNIDIMKKINSNYFLRLKILNFLSKPDFKGVAQLWYRVLLNCDNRLQYWYIVVYDSLWSCLTLFDSVWLYLTLFDSVWLCWTWSDWSTPKSTMWVIWTFMGIWPIFSSLIELLLHY